MSYPHDSFPFVMGPEQQPNVYYHQPLPFAPYMQPQQAHHQPDMMYHPYGYPTDYAEYLHMGLMPDEFDMEGEVTTRPRLTKEQVDILETQFQAHPKPNSMVKRQLAAQTKLTLPRVAVSVAAVTYSSTS